MKIRSIGILSLVMALLAGNVLAGGHNEAMKDPKKMEAFLEEKLNRTTGMESQQKELGEKVAAIVKEMSPEKSNLDPEVLGHYVNIAVRTMNHNSAYQHEFNDALVKLHLTAVAFAKERNMYAELVDNDVKTTKFMMQRVGAGIKMTGREDFALKAIFEQTTCFYQLVDDLTWNSPTSVTYTSPFKRVLEASQKVGIFKGLTEQEVHENYIIPRYQAYAEIMGVKINVSPLGANGEVTVSLIES